MFKDVAQGVIDYYKGTTHVAQVQTRQEENISRLKWTDTELG